MTMARKTAWEDVAVHIKTMVFDGELRRDERVPQDEIAADLGVSRIPVREALIALQRESWVRMIPHRGAFVVGFDDSSVTDHYAVLGRIYGLVAERAAERATPEHVAELVALHKALLAATSADAFSTANDALLGALRRVGGSPRISAILRSIAGIVPGNFFALVEGTQEIQTKGLGKAIKAIKAGDPEAAEVAMIAVMADQGDAVRRLMRARGVIT